MVTDRTEQEAKELEQLKANSPYELPDDAAKSGWTAAQIKEKFYAGLFYIYSLFKALRNSNDTFTNEMTEDFNVLEGRVQQVLDNLTAEYDIDGNKIVETYAKIVDLTNGTIPVLKYVTSQGGNEKISKIANDLANFIVEMRALFDNSKAKAALNADKATFDSSGHKFELYYTPLVTAQALQSSVTNILNGTSVVGKALKDSDGNTINTTYVKIANIIDSLVSTSTTQPLSANQGRVLQGKIDTILSLIASNDTDLDTVQEIVNYIKNNKSLIDGVTTNKVNVSDIVDNLTSQLANKPLSANQGYVLKALIDTLSNTKANAADVYTKEEAGAVMDTKISGITGVNVITDKDEDKVFDHRLLIKGKKVYLAVTDISEIV